MFKINALVILATVLASCTGQQNSKTADTKDTVLIEGENLWSNGRYCFMRTHGEYHQDTTVVQLIVEGSTVEGKMDWIPYEKDSRRGTLNGRLAGDKITAMWHFMQEGIKDSLELSFRLAPQQLDQKPLKVDTTNYRERTDESSDYSISFPRSENCN